MSRLLRAMVLALVAAFAAGATVHAASLAAMTTTMAAMQPGDEAAADCDACVSDAEGVVACDLICAPQLSGAVEEAAALPQVHGSLIRDAGDVLAAGRRAPPDPFPPRSAIPS